MKISRRTFDPTIAINIHVAVDLVPVKDGVINNIVLSTVFFFFYNISRFSTILRRAIYKNLGDSAIKYAKKMTDFVGVNLHTRINAQNENFELPPKYDAKMNNLTVVAYILCILRNFHAIS